MSIDIGGGQCALRLLDGAYSTMSASLALSEYGDSAFPAALVSRISTLSTWTPNVLPRSATAFLTADWQGSNLDLAAQDVHKLRYRQVNRIRISNESRKADWSIGPVGGEPSIYHTGYGLPLMLALGVNLVLKPRFWDPLRATLSNGEDKWGWEADSSRKPQNDSHELTHSHGQWKKGKSQDKHNIVRVFCTQFFDGFCERDSSARSISLQGHRSDWSTIEYQGQAQWKNC